MNISASVLDRQWQQYWAAVRQSSSSSASHVPSAQSYTGAAAAGGPAGASLPIHSNLLAPLSGAATSSPSPCACASSSAALTGRLHAELAAAQSTLAAYRGAMENAAAAHAHLLAGRQREGFALLAEAVRRGGALAAGRGAGGEGGERGGQGAGWGEGAGWEGAGGEAAAAAAAEGAAAAVGAPTEHVGSKETRRKNKQRARRKKELQLERRAAEGAGGAGSGEEGEE
jgi:hypothetical protein